MRSFALGTFASFVAVLPLAAQLRVETGGGQAHLDQMPSSSLTALGGSLDALFGHTRFQLAGQADARPARLRRRPGRDAFKCWLVAL